MLYLLGFLALFFTIFVVQIVRFVYADADLALLWKVRFGKRSLLLRGKVVWITGASSGIGEHLALQLARVGCRLVLSARRIDELVRVKKQCLRSCILLKESDIFIQPLDLLNYDSHIPAARQVIEYFGEIDILVNNAGVSQRAMAANTTLEVDKQLLDVNVLGTLSLTKAVLPYMIHRKAGQIVVTSGILGKIATPFAASETASKQALQGWFNALRLELVPENIQVTLVCPGPTVSHLRETAFAEQLRKTYGPGPSQFREHPIEAQPYGTLREQATGVQSYGAQLPGVQQYGMQNIAAQTHAGGHHASQTHTGGHHAALTHTGGHHAALTHTGGHHASHTHGAGMAFKRITGRLQATTSKLTPREPTTGGHQDQTIDRHSPYGHDPQGAASQTYGAQTSQTSTRARMTGQQTSGPQIVREPTSGLQQSHEVGTGQVVPLGQKKMSTERCAQLMVVAIVNRLDEVWISMHPILLITYMAQYLPGFTNRWAKRVGLPYFQKLQEVQ